ncbi:MAG: phosphoribosylamine--glycine ligase [Alistipes sp.]|nr:phosphoribosylamine--glycine ligase [Alistipes sp.]
MKVLVVGSGGRCHAIVERLSKSPQVDKIFCAPGNAGIAALAECVAIKETEVEKLKAFAIDNSIELTVVGPEVALEAGIANSFKDSGLRIFGPTREAACIETSKQFAKDLMHKYGVPTAAYATFEDFDAAMEYVKAGSLPTVLKYDGLAAGKGVVIAETMEEAEEALRDMLQDEKFGKGKVVVEEYLEGPEFSLLCFVNGKDVYPMPVAQDHKRAYDGDKGPNTGGMGAYTKLPFITDEDLAYAMDKIMRPTAAAMVEEGCPFCGVLYGGLMKTKSGIKVIEFNARFGDPETEVILPRMTSDICQVFCDVADGKQPTIEWNAMATLGIVLASKGYPGSYEKGYAIEGTEEVDGSIYHMGTALKDGKYVTSGGRVMIVVCEAPTLREAQQKAAQEVAKIKCENLFHRTDIGDKAFKY